VRPEAVKVALELGNDINAHVDFGDYPMEGDGQYRQILNRSRVRMWTPKRDWVGRFHESPGAISPNIRITYKLSPN
jgi:hypothetical protein